MSALPEQNALTASEWETWLSLPETTRAEFIHGKIYYMASPSRIHQALLARLVVTLTNHIDEKGGSCRVYPAPFSVRLDKEKDNYLEPDISVICDKDKLTDAGCVGAPDWIIEIASPGDPAHDYVVKLGLYRDAGVREYWIVNPMDENVIVYRMDGTDFRLESYTLKDTVSTKILDGLSVDFKQLMGLIDL